MIPALKKLTGEAECEPIAAGHRGGTLGECPGCGGGPKEEMCRLEGIGGKLRLCLAGEVAALQGDVGWEEKASVCCEKAEHTGHWGSRGGAGAQGAQWGEGRPGQPRARDCHRLGGLSCGEWGHLNSLQYRGHTQSCVFGESF